LFAERITSLASLAITSNPPGASISLNGKQTGTTTPGQVRLTEGLNKVVLEKKDYAVYTLELEVRRDLNGSSAPVPSPSPYQISLAQTSNSPAAVTAGTAAALPAPGKIVEGGIGSGNQTIEIPTYSIKATLSMAVAGLIQLPGSLPDSRILKTRYLPAAPELLELTEQVAGNGSLAAGPEGIASGLWIYDTLTGLSRPVVIANQALAQMLRYYELPQAGSSGSNPDPLGLGRLALAAPALSPDGRSLALVSHLLPDPHPTSPSAVDTANSPGPSTLADWNTQAIWKLAVSGQVSPGGAWLAGSASSGVPESSEGKGINDPTNHQPEEGRFEKLASLADLVDILPGFKPVSTNTGNAGSGGNSLYSRTGASFEEISWNLEGNRLLLVIKPSTVNDLNSSNSTTALVLTGTEPGNLKLVTPLPLPVAVLPGTTEWSRSSNAVSFLVRESNQATGLCVLELDPVEAAAEPGKPANSTAQAPGNPLHYLGRLGGKGIWADNSVSTPTSTNSGGKSFPSTFGSARYNPFAWVDSGSQAQNFSPGFYAKGAPEWATGPGQEFDTLYGYFPYTGGIDQAATALDPLTLDRKQLEANSQARDNLPQDSFPLWLAGPYGEPHVLYLSSRPAQSSGSFLGGNTYLEISINELNLQNTPFGSVMQTALNLQPQHELTDAQAAVTSPTELRVTLLRAYSDRIRLPAFEDTGSRDFEAEINPAGTGAIIALPEARGERKVQFWLATWV
jgi:hypothetical protein